MEKSAFSYGPGLPLETENTQRETLHAGLHSPMHYRGISVDYRKKVSMEWSRV
jgi:hypothetical protein